MRNVLDSPKTAKATTSMAPANNAVKALTFSQTTHVEQGQVRPACNKTEQSAEGLPQDLWLLEDLPFLQETTSVKYQPVALFPQLQAGISYGEQTALPGPSISTASDKANPTDACNVPQISSRLATDDACSGEATA